MYQTLSPPVVYQTSDRFGTRHFAFPALRARESPQDPKRPSRSRTTTSESATAPLSLEEVLRQLGTGPCLAESEFRGGELIPILVHALDVKEQAKRELAEREGVLLAVFRVEPRHEEHAARRAVEAA